MTETCRKCRFWDITGECRRNAPTLVCSDGLAIFPTTRENDWCGEFRGLPVANEALARERKAGVQIMTIAELIQKLKTCDQTLEVRFDTEDLCCIKLGICLRTYFDHELGREVLIIGGW